MESVGRCRNHRLDVRSGSADQRPLRSAKAAWQASHALGRSPGCTTGAQGPHCEIRTRSPAAGSVVVTWLGNTVDGVYGITAVKLTLSLKFPLVSSVVTANSTGLLVLLQ
jgi:hypothetical protein